MSDIETCSLQENVDEYFLDENKDFFTWNYKKRLNEADSSLKKTLELIEKIW